MRVLLVDPDLDGRARELAAALAERGHGVMRCADVSAAHALLEGALFELAVAVAVDDTSELLRLCGVLKTSGRATFVLALLSTARPEVVSPLLDAGVDDFFVLPFEAERFTARLRVAERAIEQRAMLRQSESTLRAFYDGSGVMMALVEREGAELRILSCNPALAARFTRSTESVSGERVSDLLPEVAAEWTERCAETEALGKPKRYEWQRGEGPSARWFTSTVNAVNAPNEPARFCITAEEITDRMRLNSRLLLADRLVSVGTLAAGVAHEINNPLTYVIANLEFVSRHLTKHDGGDRGERLQQAIAQAREGADRVRQIVRNLRTFSRGEEDRRGPVSVTDVMESSLDMAWNEIRHRAQLERDYHPVSPVEANEARLGQVFLNLLVNAAQAIPEGRVEQNLVRVSAREAGGKVIVEVSDTGGGIPKEIVGRVFDPFFTTKPVGEGTGLGLSICHGIVAGLGGEIQIESEPGRGSTFRVLLPASNNKRVEPRTSAPPGPAGGRARVLIVDDEASLRVSLAQILASEHDVSETASGHEVLDKIRAGERFDVILCDLMMPEMSGVDLFRSLEELAPDQSERVVFLTGGAFTPRSQEFLERVPNARLEKPFEIDELLVLIRKTMR